MVLVSRTRIQIVINCGWWQNVRISMKGTSTADKLVTCELWLNNDDGCGYMPDSRRSGNDVYSLYENAMSTKELELHFKAIRRPHVGGEPCDWSARRDQVLNYLTALSRGGLIAPLHVDVWLPAFRAYGTINFGLIEIKR
jgi:hypothetical protein